jgi:hypothetical protein
VKSLQTISVRHPTKFELMIYVDAKTPIGFTIPHHARPRRRGDRVAIRFAAVRESEGGTHLTSLFDECPLRAKSRLSPIERY